MYICVSLAIPSGPNQNNPKLSKTGINQGKLHTLVSENTHADEYSLVAAGIKRGLRVIARRKKSEHLQYEEQLLNSSSRDANRTVGKEDRGLRLLNDNKDGQVVQQRHHIRQELLEISKKKYILNVRLHLKRHTKTCHNASMLRQFCWPMPPKACSRHPQRTRDVD